MRQGHPNSVPNASQALPQEPKMAKMVARGHPRGDLLSHRPTFIPHAQAWTDCRSTPPEGAIFDTFAPKIGPKCLNEKTGAEKDRH